MGSLPHVGMPACGVSWPPASSVAVADDDGVDYEPGQGCHEAGRHAVSTGGTGPEEDHSRRIVRDEGLAPRSRSQGAAAGPDAEVVRARQPRSPICGEEVIVALRFCWAVLGAAAGQWLAPFLPELVARLRKVGELNLDDATAGQLVQMSAATIDRRLAADRAKLLPHGRSHTKPGSLLKDAIPIRTFAEWDDAVPEFVEIDLVGHEGGISPGEFCSTLTVTDIALGWTENRTVRNKAQRWVFDSLTGISVEFPFPIRGIDSDNGNEFINNHLLRYCETNQITFTRSRPGKSNDGAHVEQKNWAVVRQVAGYHRYDTEAELQLLNRRRRRGR
jgi:hypothetical protein